MKSSVTNIMAAFICGQLLEIALSITASILGFEACTAFGAVSGIIITLSVFAGIGIAGIGTGAAKHAKQQPQKQQKKDDHKAVKA